MTKNTFIDQTGRELKISESINKIVCLVPSITELLFFFGLEEKIVGITEYCVHPEKQVKNANKIGGPKNPDIEKIKELEPDLVIGSVEENTQNKIEKISEFAPVWLSDVKSVDSACKMITSLGELFDKTDLAENIANNIKKGFKEFDRSQKVKVAYLIWENPLMTVGNDTFIDNILGQMGFINVFANKNRYPKIEPEELANSGAEFILLPSEPYDFKNEHIEQYKKLCPNAKAILVDGQMFSWYGNHMLVALGYLKRIQNLVVTMKKYSN